jgi:hypothetical protein
MLRLGSLIWPRSRAQDARRWRRAPPGSASPCPFDLETCTTGGPRRRSVLDNRRASFLSWKFTSHTHYFRGHIFGVAHHIFGSVGHCEHQIVARSRASGGPNRPPGFCRGRVSEPKCRASVASHNVRCSDSKSTSTPNTVPKKHVLPASPQGPLVTSPIRNSYLAHNEIPTSITEAQTTTEAHRSPVSSPHLPHYFRLASPLLALPRLASYVFRDDGSTPKL